MKINAKLIIVLFVSIFVLVSIPIIYWFFLRTSIDEQKAIQAIKSQYTQLATYPSSNLPPKSIKTEKSFNGKTLYIAFIQEGSGLPILFAKCFKVDENYKVTENGEYSPNINNQAGTDFDIKNCSLKGSVSEEKCVVQNCHGTDIVCGPKQPQVCTAVYEIGDKCLQYAKCGVVNGKCQQVEDEKFKSCVSCVHQCNEKYSTNPTKLFECESSCE